MENAGPQGPGEGVVLNKDDEAQDHAGPLEAEGGEKDRLDQADHPLEGVHIQRLLHQQAALDAHPLAGGQDQPNANRRDAQAAHLDQRRHHHLSEDGKMVVNVNGDQARDAHGAGGGEEGVDKGDLHAGLNRDREHQQDSPQQDHCGKAQGNEAPGGLPLQKCNKM